MDGLHEQNSLDSNQNNFIYVIYLTNVFLMNCKCLACIYNTNIMKPNTHLCILNPYLCKTYNDIIGRKRQ